MLQETHYYQTTHYHVKGVENTAKRAGWTAYHAQATATDPKRGVAILVRADSQTPDSYNNRRIATTAWPEW
jgi:hypothetical protein